ncbi:MAG: phosphotransferase, partial [Alphaproteobacteria bacterium]
GIYLREALFYEILATSVRLQPPACHGAVYDIDSRLSVLLLEDLTDLEVGVQAAGYTPEHARATVLQLADHHAAFWADETLVQHEAWLPVWNQPEMVTFVAGSYDQAWQACKAMYEARLDDADIALGERLGDALPALMEAIGTAPVTLLHGDARYDNLLFETADPTLPPRTVDWQFVARGRGAQDVAYFLTQSGDPALAAAIETDLVDAYHARLATAGVAGYTLDDCRTDYRRCALYSLVYPIFTAPMVSPDDAAQYEAIAIALRRGFDAAARLNAAELAGA